MPHTFKFVDKIDPSRTVRLDLNDLSVWTLLHDGTEFTPPPIRRAEVSTMLVDGERYPSTAYGNRELQLNLMVGTLSADLVAEQVQKLQRELDRPTNILEWKPKSATHPVFFKTFRSPPDSIREWRGDDGRKGITANVMAEPFAYGLRETLPAVTVNNDPDAVVQQVIEDFEDASLNFTVTNGGNAPWARDSTQFQTGAWSFKSGTITHLQTSDAIVTVPTGASRIRFWYKTDSETFDKLRFLVGATEVLAVGGPGGAWTQSVQFGIPDGTTTVTFRYQKDSSVSTGADAVWVDNVEFFTAAGNRMFLDVTAVKGDVETPAFLEFPAPSWPSGTFTAFSVRRRGNPANMTHFLQAEAMTQGTDTTTQVNDAAFSGSGNNYSRCTFATNANLVTRLNITNWPSGSTRDELRGSYRVYARVRRNDATATSMRLRLKWGFSTLVSNDTVTSWTATATEFALVDLGLVSFPRAADPVTVGPSGTDIPSYGMHFELHAQKFSGTANLDIDYLLLLPADDALLLFDHADGAQGDVVIDGYNETMYARWTTGHVLSMNPWRVAGRFPLLSPGVTNRLFFLRDINGGGDLVTTTTSVTVSYWPRYVYVRGAST